MPLFQAVWELNLFNRFDLKALTQGVECHKDKGVVHKYFGKKTVIIKIGIKYNS